MMPWTMAGVTALFVVGYSWFDRHRAGEQPRISLRSAGLSTDTITRLPTTSSRLIGFVDQEDTLMSTPTVYETVLYSLETISESGIVGIKGSRIGDVGYWSISGSEKRRGLSACELETSPSILLLDEPTSGTWSLLSSSAAHLWYRTGSTSSRASSLARGHNRTDLFTANHPRSNIIGLFDQVILLASAPQEDLTNSGDESRSFYVEVLVPLPDRQLNDCRTGRLRNCCCAVASHLRPAL
uniref:ABC transporter domain-containing protein n=1 Tax=Mycena chlorophos TaxID=658473 RepID=A0ABQ0L0N5_MYCCL|nr:predicted protein [Mycena chlorophos]